MKFNDVHVLVKDYPYITETDSRLIYDFILENRCRNVLELGFAHGKASCYIAAALDELGEGGRLVSVDLLDVKDFFQPSIEDLLERTGLAGYVEVVREQTGYNWFLHNEIKAQTGDGAICLPKYDLCIIDGPKNWTIDGSAFFCADKLLNEGGWMIFDDYSWTYEKADAGREATDGITHRQLSDDERRIPHIREVFHLLVMQHPNYSNFKLQEEGKDWVWAQKLKSDVKNVSFQYNYTYKDVLSKYLYKIRKALAGS
jgi:predicted O-methyltransferase YrrM